jgi:hypothetical protein
VTLACCESPILFVQLNAHMHKSRKGGGQTKMNYRIEKSLWELGYAQQKTLTYRTGKNSRKLGWANCLRPYHYKWGMCYDVLFHTFIFILFVTCHVTATVMCSVMVMVTQTCVQTQSGLGLDLSWWLMMVSVRGHPSVSLPPLSSSTLPLFICILPTPLYHLQEPHPKADDLCIQSPDVDSLKVVDIPLLPLLIPQRHRTCLGCIRIGLCDTTASSAVTWKASYGRLGTGRLGTVITSIYFVVEPSQGSLERSLWISPASSPCPTGEGKIHDQWWVVLMSDLMSKILWLFTLL